MPVTNLSKKHTIIDSFRLCINSFEKFMGLMFTKSENKALIFKFNKERKIHLHMFFVFYPIDVLLLNKAKIVVDKIENFKPFTIYKSKKIAMYSIELPQGLIKKTNTEIGDKINF